MTRGISSWALHRQISPGYLMAIWSSNCASFRNPGASVYRTQVYTLGWQALLAHVLAQ